MKEAIAWILALGLVAPGCSKTKETNKPATILSVRYSCGVGCDASAFVVKPTGDSNHYLPASLPPVYQVHNLPVIIDYTKTGDFPEPNKGPDMEIIHINNITR